MVTFTEKAGHVPSFLADEISWKKLEFPENSTSLALEVPVLTAEQCDRLTGHIETSSAEFLKKQTTNAIIELIDAAIERLLNRDDPVRQKAEQLLPLITGFDAEMIRLSLTDYLKTFRKPQLQRFINEDFANPKILDEFQPIMKGGFAKAFGPDCLLHIWAGNVPGLPLWSLISGLLVKAGNIGKVSSSEPLFASLFVKLLIEIEPKLSDCLAVLWWEGGTKDQETILLKNRSFPPFFSIKHLGCTLLGTVVSEISAVVSAWGVFMKGIAFVAVTRLIVERLLFCRLELLFFQTLFHFRCEWITSVRCLRMLELTEVATAVI